MFKNFFKHDHHTALFVQVLAGILTLGLGYLLSKFVLSHYTGECEGESCKQRLAEKKEERNKQINKKVMEELLGRFKKENDVYIKQLNVAVRDKFIQFINEVEKMGYAVKVTSGYRSFQEQIALKAKDKRNAAPGFSSHNYGTALDMVLYKDGKMYGKGAAYTDLWKKSGVPELAKTKYGMRWGGEFPGYPDEVHFDYNNKYDTKKLYAMAIEKFGSPEKAKGNELQLT